MLLFDQSNAMSDYAIMIIMEGCRQKLVHSIEEELKDCVDHYRQIHQRPEIGLEEHSTAAYIRGIIDVEGVIIDPPIADLPTAIIARLQADDPNAPTVLLRCQLDALPLKEESGLPHASTNGLHHACGHDGHMASLIAALRHAARHRKELKRSLVFCFQPGEEGKGGANKLFKARPDLLEGVKECYAIHFYNGMYPGTIALGKGAVTAHSSRFLIDIEGKSTHCMAPNAGIDANYIGCILVGQLYSLISLKVSPLHGATLVVYKISGGGDASKVSNRFELAATIKATTTLDFQKLQQTITDLTNGLCLAYGAKANIRFITDLYRPVVNDEVLTVELRNKLRLAIPGLKIVQEQKSFAGEDFCEFSERRPSVMIAVGSGMPDSIDPVTKNSKYPLHSPLHRFDEAVFPTSTKIWSAIMFT